MSFEKGQKDRLFKFVQLCAKKNGGVTAGNITNFGITNQEQLFEIAKLCVQQNGYGTVCHIHRFGITNQNHLFEIAKLCAQQDGRRTGFFIPSFGITDQDQLFEIAKLCAQQDGRTGFFITKFGITNQNKLFEIAKLCAQQNGEETGRFITIFGITDQDHLYEIAKLCAQQDGKGTARYIMNFGITNQDRLFEIGLLCIRNCPSENSRFRCFQDLGKVFNVFALQVLAVFINNPNDYNQAEKCLCLYQNQFANRHFEEFFTLIARIEEPHVRYQNYEFLANVMVLCKALLDEDQIQCLRKSKILESIFKFGRPNLKFPLFLAAALLAKSSEGLKKIDALQGELDWQKKLTQLLAARLELEGIDISNFLKMIEKASLFKAKENQQALIEMLLLMAEEKNLPKQLILERICKEIPEKGTKGDREKAYLRNIQSVISILEFKETVQFKDQSRSLSTIAEDILKKKFLCGNIEEFASKYNETFRNCRNPSAIVTYASKIKSDKIGSEYFGAFMASTLNKTFLLDRYKLENNLHLQTLNKYDSKLIEKWKCNQSIELSRLNFDPSKIVQEPLSSKEWLKQKIAENHLKQFQLNDLNAYLKKGEEVTKSLGVMRGKLGKELKISDSSQTDILTKQLDTVSLQLLCIQYIEVSDNTLPSLYKEYAKEMDQQKKGQIDIRIKSAVDQLKQYLDQLQKIVSKNAYAPCEFSNDLDGKIRDIKEINATVALEREIVEETDDPIDILLCGTEVSGSCQRVDGDPNLNKGLLGYLMNGNKLLAVKGSEGTFKAGCLLRLLWDGEKPVLFMERLYPDNIKDRHRQALEYLAKQKAIQLGIPLCCKSETGQEYNKPLYALGGPSPYEYCDAVSSITDGKYTIKNVKLL
ncbi:MAG: hypothetical protein H0U49_03925 [Parachlamydiaceae bacterium]|nr:hypothetical protein [Parachlamydiaceae bacterium]